MAFFEKMPYLFPHTDAKSWFDSKPEAAIETISAATEIAKTPRLLSGMVLILPDRWNTTNLY